MANRNMQENKQTENTMTKIIDGKTYKVQVHFSETSKETIQDKIKRMLRSEIRNRET